MDRSSGKAAGGMSRRIQWLGIGVVIAMAAYSGLWFFLAHQLETRSEALLSDLANGNVEAQCEAMEVRGYPFRLGVFCDSVSADDSASGATLAAGSFRSAAQVYKPNHIVSELDGPVTLTAPDGTAADMNWQVLSASTVFDLSGLSRASIQTSDFTAKVRPAAVSETLDVKADATEAHLRRSNADLDAAIRLKSTKLTSGGLDLPAFDLESTVTLADRAWMLSGGQRDGNPWRNLSAALNSMSATIGEARLLASGPFSIDEDGLLTAKLNVEISGRDAWQQILSEAIPDAADTISNGLNLLSGIGSSQDSLTLPININRGRITLGFIPLGTVPPL